MSDERTFKVAVKCDNCGAEWEVDAPFKADIQTGLGGVFVHPVDCVAWSGAACKGYHIECPTCGTTGKVYRRRRRNE